MGQNDIWPWKFSINKCCKINSILKLFFYHSVVDGAEEEDEEDEAGGS